jgi:hypothetical protein
MFAAFIFPSLLCIAGESRGRLSANGILPAGLTTGAGQKALTCLGGAAEVEENSAKGRL